MKRRLAALLSYTVLFCAPALCAEESRPAAVGHSSWDVLLKNYVNEQSRVDYRRLAAENLPQLDAYLAELARPGAAALDPAESKALLINAYNALTVRWILEYFPVPSIWSTPDPFKKVRHTLGGKRVSLDQIEAMLRAMGDPRVHAALVCAARSCPPLRREAYTAERMDEQLDDNTRRWLANPELNRFDAKSGEAQVSPIFQWYRDDFNTYPGNLDGFLKHYAPAGFGQALGDRKLEIRFAKYDWGLNDQGDLGENYSSWRMGLDWLRNLFR
jgi:Protein of unknown function, DUF547